MSILWYILYLFLIAFFEVIGRSATGFFGVTLNLAAMVVVIFALTKPELSCLWFGFWVGLVMSAGNPIVMGWQILALVAIAVAVHHSRERLNVESLTARMAMLFAGVFAHNIITLIITQPEGFFYQLWRTALTGAVYTSVLAYMFFRIVETFAPRAFARSN